MAASESDGAGRPSVHHRGLEAASSPLAPRRLLLPSGYDSCPLSPSPRALCSFSFLQYVNLILQLNKNLRYKDTFTDASFVLIRLSTQPTMQISTPARAGSRCDQSVVSALSLGRECGGQRLCVWVEGERPWCCHCVLDSSYVKGLASFYCKTVIPNNNHSSQEIKSQATTKACLIIIFFIINLKLAKPANLKINQTVQLRE